MKHPTGATFQRRSRAAMPVVPRIVNSSTPNRSPNGAPKSNVGRYQGEKAGQ